MKKPIKAENHAQRVREMFGRISPHYDLMNRIMTLGRDRQWRQHAVKMAELSPESVLLDLGCGTGDIAHEAFRRNPSGKIVAADFTLSMIATARKRNSGEKVIWVAADAMELPFADESFDAVVSGYLMRNVADLNQALKEQFRVLKPGGKMVCLDTSPPPSNIFKPFILFYFKIVIPIFGGLISKDKAAYRYLPESTNRFLSPTELANAIASVGFISEGYRQFMFGTQAVHVGIRPHRYRNERSQINTG